MFSRIYRALQGFARLRTVSQNVSILCRNTKSLCDYGDTTARLLAQQEIARMLAAPELAESQKRLERFGFKAFSQNDEDGIIQEIFRRIGITNKKFIEFGTGNGPENNTVYLLFQDWTGLWMDGSVECHQAQLKNFAWARDDQRLTCVCQMLTAENINSVIEEADFKGEIDLLSIDVDGNDYHLWKAITAVQPRVVVIEYNGFLAPPVRWVMQYNPSHVWDRTLYCGASLESLELLGRRKGYTLVGCNLIGLNAFFVRTNLVKDKFVADGSATHLFHPRRFWLDLFYRIEGVPLDRPFIMGEPFR